MRRDKLDCSELKEAVKGASMVDSFDQLGKEDGGVAREDRSAETFASSTSMVVQREPDERGSTGQGTASWTRKRGEGMDAEPWCEIALDARIDNILWRRQSEDGCRFGHVHRHKGTCLRVQGTLFSSAKSEARLSAEGRKLGMPRSLVKSGEALQ